MRGRTNGVSASEESLQVEPAATTGTRRLSKVRDTRLPNLAPNNRGQGVRVRRAGLDVRLVAVCLAVFMDEDRL